MASSPQRFAGAVLFEVNRPLTVVTDLCCPRLSKGQVLVRMRYAGVCHSQIMEAKGKRGNDRYLPHMLGHEGVGEVLEIGPGVKKVKEGDQVVVGWMKDKGLEGGPKVYSSASFGDINAGSCTTFSEFSVLSENRVYKKPKNTATDQCVLYGCALPTGAGLVFNELKPKPNANIGVLGLGGVGLSAIVAAKTFSPKNLVALDIEDTKLSLALKLGATAAVKASDQGVIEKVKAITDGNMFDYLVEAAGKTQTIEQGFSLIHPHRGELIFASHPEHGEKISLDPFELISGKSIKGSWGGGAKPVKDMLLIDEMVANGVLDLAPLLDKTYDLYSVNEALDDLENRKIVRALIDLRPET